MAKHMDEGPVKEEKKQKLPDNRLLKLFTILAEAKDATRIQSTETLLKLLTEQQAKIPEGLCEDVIYAINRLIAGLTSGRKFARLGYSVALCQLLRQVKEINTKVVLQSLNAKVKTLTTANSSKKEQGNAYLGKVFGYAALVHSGKLFDDGKDEITQVVDELLSLSSKRSYLCHLSLSALCSIINKVKTKVFRDKILPKVKDHLMAGWADCTPEKFCLVLACSVHHQEAVANLLREHWGGADVLVEKNWKHLATIVMKSPSLHTCVHTVNTEILNCLLERSIDVVKFWKAVIHPLYETKINPWPKRMLGVYYFNRLLPLLQDPDKLQTVLHPDVTGVLAKHLSNKKSQITDDQSKVITAAIEGIQGLMRDAPSVDAQLTLMKSLVKSPGSCHLLSHIFGNFAVQLLPEACNQLQQEAMKVFTRQSSWLVNLDEITDDHLNWSIHELSTLVTSGNMVTNGNLTSDWQLNILKFLLLHSFFDVTKSSTAIDHCAVTEVKMSAMVQKGVMDNLLKALQKLIVFNVKGQSRYSQLCGHLDTMWGLLQYADKLLNHPDCVQLRHGDLDDQQKSQWSKLLSAMQSIQKKRKQEDKFGALHAFELLFFYQALQLFVDPKADTDALEDLHTCYKKATEKRKSKASDDGPEWISVVTEFLVSLMFKDQALSRVIAKEAIVCLSNHVTSESLQIILEALQQTSLDSLAAAEDEEEVEEEDRSDEDDDALNIDSDVPYESEDESEEEDEDEEKEEEESDVEEETDLTVPEDLKQKLKAALGKAAPSDSEEEEDEEELLQEDVELSDSEMFQLDEVLAAAFRSMRRGNKNKDKEHKLQLINFKIRVLDLLEAIVKHYPKVTLIKDMILPLLELTEQGRRDKESVKLGNSAHNLLQLMFKVKSFIPDDEVDGDELLELFSQLMALAGKESSQVSELAKCCLLVVRVLLNLHDDHTGPSPLKTRSKASAKSQDSDVKGTDYYQERVVSLIQAGLHELFQRTTGHCPASFFHTVIDRYPLMFWSLSGMLQTTMVSPDVKVYPKTQAASILSSMVTKKLVNEIGASGMEEFIQEMNNTASQVLRQMDPANVKMELLRSLLDICLKLHKLSPLTGNTAQVLGQQDLEVLGEMKKAFNHDVTSLYRKLTANSLPNGQAKKRKKEKKEKKKQSPTEDQSLAKKSKLVSQSTVNDNHEESDNVPHTMATDTPSSVGKKKKKSRKSLANESGTDNANNAVTAEDDDVNGRKLGEMTLNSNTPSSHKKKKKKRKSAIGAVVDNDAMDDQAGAGLVNGGVTVNGLTSQEDDDEEMEISPQKKKKKGRKSNVAEDKFSPRYTRSMDT